MTSGVERLVPLRGQLVISPRTGRGIDRETLRSAFRKELDRGRAIAGQAVANALYNNAVNSNNVAAQIWWSKARMRWSETPQTFTRPSGRRDFGSV